VTTIAIIVSVAVPACIAFFIYSRVVEFRNFELIKDRIACWRLEFNRKSAKIQDSLNSVQPFVVDTADEATNSARNSSDIDIWGEGILPKSKEKDMNIALMIKVLNGRASKESIFIHYEELPYSIGRNSANDENSLHFNNNGISRHQLLISEDAKTKLLHITCLSEKNCTVVSFQDGSLKCLKKDMPYEIPKKEPLILYVVGKKTQQNALELENNSYMSIMIAPMYAYSERTNVLQNAI
jgi:hypothetical protein